MTSSEDSQTTLWLVFVITSIYILNCDSFVFLVLERTGSFGRLLSINRLKKWFTDSFESTRSHYLLFIVIFSTVYWSCQLSFFFDLMVLLPYSQVYKYFVYWSSESFKWIASKQQCELNITTIMQGLMRAGRWLHCSYLWVVVCMCLVALFMCHFQVWSSIIFSYLYYCLKRITI